jgi:hypothetical protein
MVFGRPPLTFDVDIVHRTTPEGNRRLIADDLAVPVICFGH